MVFVIETSVLLQTRGFFNANRIEIIAFCYYFTHFVTISPILDRFLTPMLSYTPISLLYSSVITKNIRSDKITHPNLISDSPMKLKWSQIVLITL